jgi:hypothetical protein
LITLEVGVLEKGLVPRVIGITQVELNLAVQKLIKLELVKRIPSQILPHTGDLVLTGKGRSVVDHLAEIQLLLTKKSQPAMDEDLGNLLVARTFVVEKKSGMTSPNRKPFPSKIGSATGSSNDEAGERTKDIAWKQRKPKEERG